MSSSLKPVTLTMRLAAGAICAIAVTIGGASLSLPTATALEAPATMSWPDLTSRPRPVPTAERQIGPAATNLAEAWIPDAPGPYPVVIMIHGGCWQKAIADRTLMHYAAEALRTAGVAVWNIEYRGVDEPGGGYPGTFADVALAVDAVKNHGDEFNFDLSKIVVYGHSAGGHLALWAGARSNLPQSSPLWNPAPLVVSAAVNTGGLADLAASAPVTLESCLATVLDDLIGPSSDTRPIPYADTSPDRLLPIGIKQVSINATHDRIAPPMLGEAYTAKAIAAGDDAAYVEVPGGHVELIAPDTAAFDQTISTILDLVAED